MGMPGGGRQACCLTRLEGRGRHGWGMEGEQWNGRRTKLQAVRQAMGKAGWQGMARHGRRAGQAAGPPPLLCSVVTQAAGRGGGGMA